jgi:LysM repeat protein
MKSTLLLNSIVHSAMAIRRPGAAGRQAYKRSGVIEQAGTWDVSSLAVRAMLTGWLTLFAVAGVIVVLLVGASWLRVSGRIIPGVRVAETYLGGLTVEQAASALERDWNPGALIQISDGIRTWTIPASQLGLRYDTERTALQAAEVGRAESVFVTLYLALQGMFEGLEAEPRYWLDPHAALDGLEALRPEIDIHPMNAGLRIEDGKLVATPAVHGYSLDLEQTLTAIALDPAGVLERGSAGLKIKQVEPRVLDVTSALVEAEAILERGVELVAHDPITGQDLTWKLAREDIAGFLLVGDGPDGPTISLDESKLSGYLQNLSDTLLPERWLELPVGLYNEQLSQGNPIRAVVRHSPTAYTVQSGDTLLKISWAVGMPYWKLLEDNPGMDEQVLIPGQILQVPSKDEMLPLPVVYNKRIVISISQQRMWVYQDGDLLWENIISTGIDRSPTQPGIFQVQTHELSAYASIWDLTMPHWLGIYEAWPGFMNGIHGLPTLSNGQRLWAGNLGRPISYGCIILDLEAAERLYHWADPGVVVEIQP